MKTTSIVLLPLAAVVTSSFVGYQRGVDGILRTPEQIAAINNDADTNRKCHQSNGNYISSLKAGNYAASKSTTNTNLISKYPISTTVKGQTIYAYKLSTGAKPKALYYESLRPRMDRRVVIDLCVVVVFG
ncbi:Aste57867_9767 [Aphanomyces stellatus]|uniref:Aste57867_9767 protein n=1 Tax=Aphanomyces stellatus TaxID=120398 RepID=A0A485KNQ2_9STRA|nr:hypothetical protein As57867_009728 [Aphanomyces stellatus]VFT86646.1 Aste57867_9767 [Aphanomyces stellatus]